MPLPNGVDPWGRIHPICPSAQFLGNRGILHGDNGVITTQWKNKAWVTCALHYGGRNRKPLMKPGNYSELFFLDEATALAAGHRPCWECRRKEYSQFKAAWFATHQNADLTNSIGDVDKALHAERLTLTREKKTFNFPMDQLPFGAMLEFQNQAYLNWHNGPFLWSPTGYLKSTIPVTGSEVVKVLTPISTVNVIRAGYVPQVHESADN